MATLKTQIQIRRDTAANLANVVLKAGEPGYATDTKKLAIGDGSTKFSALQGRVMGPNTATDNALAKFDGTSGQIIQNSNATLSDAGQLKVVNWKDERYASNVAMSRWTTTAKEIIIYTKIKFVSSAVMPIVRLHGYAYGQNAPIELKIGFYIYNSAYTNMGAVSMGAWRPEIRLFKYTASDSVDYVAIGFIGTCYYGGFQVDVQAAALGTLDSNILTTGWSVSTFTTEGNVPAIGTDKSKNVPYKSTLANLTINGTIYNGSSDVTLNLATDDHTHDEYVEGPSSSTDNAIARYNGTTGKIIQNSNATIDDNGIVKATGFGDGTITIKPHNSNEINFGGTNTDTTIYFGHKATDSRPKPTSYIFGGTAADASVKANKFIKTDSSDSYVLLGGGGHKAVSDFAMTGDIPSLDNYVTLNGNQTITGDKTFTGSVITTNNKFEIKANSNTDDSWIKLTNKSDAGYYAFGIRRPYDTYGLQLKIHPASGTDTYYDIWHAGNDGSGSGLDADLLDGKHASAFALTSDIPDVSDFITEEVDTLQSVTNRGNITTNIVKIQNGDAGGSFVLGANVNSTTLTANQRKLGRMGVPSYDSTTKTIAGISFDSQQTVNLVDFGGHPNNAQSIAPDVIRFIVANSHNNAIDGARTLALQISKQDGLVDSAGGGTSVAAAKFFIPVQTTSSVSSNSGFIHTGVAAASRASSLLLANGGTKAISDFQTNGNYVTYTQNNSVSVAGTTKTTYTYGQTAIFAPNGLIMGGTAAAAGLVTRGICGVSTPNSTTGACTKDNLYLNFDGGSTTTWSPTTRGVIINAGTPGNDLGSGMYQYCAVRGDIVKAWVEAKGYITSSSLPTVNNGTLTIQRNGTTVATFTANQAGNTTANITDNDTLNTAGSTNDEAKLYLVGAKSQAASAQTYSDAEVYTQAGELNATSVCVAEHGQIRYDATNECIRFVIA